ncbi:hypothetical protein J2767_002327 [Agrobacterium tumefaciens]|nr:hypothetical protein [Agrobacterium tumefaciens]
MWFCDSNLSDAADFHLISGIFLSETLAHALSGFF